MEHLKFFALGGQDEKGKNLYLLDIEDDLFIFDCGIKLPEKGILGIDHIMTNIDFLKENEKRIKGLFLTNPSSTNCGATSIILKNLNIPIYCNELIATVIRTNAAKMRIKVKDDNIRSINNKDVVKFGKVSVEVFQTTSSYPETYGYAIHTPIGTVVYLGDYIVDGSEQSCFSTDMEHLNKIARENNILSLISDSENASRMSYTVPNHKIDKYIAADMKNLKKRLIIGIFEEDLFKFYEIANAAKDAKRKIAIYGRTLQKVLENKRVLNYLGLESKDIISIDDFEKSSDNNLLVIAGTVDGLYTQLSKIANGIDNTIEFVEDDILIIATPPAPGVEKRHAELLDELARTPAKLKALSDKNIWSMKASFEDIKLMVRMFKPKTFIPVKGLYKDLLKAEQAAIEAGVEKGKTAIIDNGQILKIMNDGDLILSKDSIKVSEIYVDGMDVGDIGSVVLNERRQLASDGVVIIGANIDVETKELISLIDMQMRGVIYIQDENPIFKTLQNNITEIIEKGTKTFKTDPNKFDLNEVKKEIVSKVRSLIKKDAGKQPIVLVVINELDGSYYDIRQKSNGNNLRP